MKRMGIDVYEAASRRLDEVFDNFEHVYVSFSGGKDSGVLLNLAIQALDRHLGRSLGVFHMDYEAQYEFTTQYVDRVFASGDRRLEFWRICIPFLVPCTTSISSTYWRPWDPEKREIWVRPMPAGAVTAEQVSCYRDGMWDYDFQDAFVREYQRRHGGGTTCCLVGIRAQESLNRWRTVYAETRSARRNWNRRKWTTDLGGGCATAYPIYDWQTEDVWAANARFGWDYNRLYDLYWQAGLDIGQMRVASPFLGAAQWSLKLYRTIEPHTWAKLLGRVNGVNFTGIYGGTTAMGWKSITLPAGHTWESYMWFLLDTLDPEIRASYLDRLATSIKFWREKGGCLSRELIAKLRARGVKMEVDGKTNYRTSKLPVRMEYLDDIDVEEFSEIPSYKRVCVCIMKNDHLCKYMGFSQTKDEIARRRAVMEKYRSIV